MNEKGYPFSTIVKGSIYAFESVSPNQRIVKLVLLTPTERSQLFNVALLDVLDDGQTSDDVESKNGDLIPVLAIVFKIMEDFLENNPECAVMFRGSDARRHRLYRIVIARELSSVSDRFEVFGGTPDKMIPFAPNVNYDHYFLKLNSYEGNETF